MKGIQIMTLLETDLTPEIMKLDTDALIGYEMTTSRERLRDFFNNPKRNTIDSDVGYAVVMSDYLNTIQKYWYEQDAATKYEVIEELPRRIKAEAQMFFESVEPIDEIANRVNTYLNDQTANSLKQRGISQYPRATTMTLLDIFDDYR